MWCIWLTDTLYALHQGSALSGFSSRELWTQMPSSPYQFQDVYRTLMDVNDIQLPLPADLSAVDDALLLLIAMLSDLLIVRRSLSTLVNLLRGAPTPHQRLAGNPFVPLTPQAELGRLQNLLRSALDKWSQQFEPFMTPEVMAFSHYCKLHLSCPEILQLPRLSGYETLSDKMTTVQYDIDVSEDALCMAWLVLDRAAERNASESLCPIWLPICVFHAALVVWAHQSFNEAQKCGERRSKRMLLAFKVELEKMPWPCCAEMGTTLERLMASSAAPGMGSALQVHRE